MSKITELACKFAKLRSQKSEITENLKILQKELDAIENEMLDEMVQEELKRVDIKDVGSFFISSRKFYKIADRDMFMDFIHEQGDTDLLTVQHQTLNAYAKELHARKEAEGISEFEIPGLEFIEKASIRLKKSGQTDDSEE